MALIDLDFFKQVNDRFGHDVGDHVLIQISQLLSEHFEPEALVARLGGEEFALMSIASEFELAQRLQALNKVLTTQPLSISEQQIYISLSAGVVTVQTEEGLNDAIIAADTFLYKAKDNGRCQVRCA
ncbi:diguanylate cyclase (GGDEF) domain-containing protein [Oceanospirillum multiglobuliferum]|nr:diguanylate cyclase (GGDEF) domain-containing protein [Oceanospirillum multiglobuliferum]